ncbi:MAG: hypothetical protein IKZ87_01135, partial [Actinomycetaceae bacterium]|nr:hypothetical protein [Actinomycetaceae bacterium]
GIKILRDTERIVQTEIPRIFTDVPEQDYELLAPLAAKMFISATKRQQIYLNRYEFENATDEQWEAHFLQPIRSGRVPGEALDFHIVYPLAQKADEGAWKRSTLDDVKDYIIEQI